MVTSAATHDPRRGVKAIRSVGLVLMMVSVTAGGMLAEAKPVQIWIAPTDDLLQHGNDIHEFFRRPELWRHAAAAVSSLSMSVTYLLRTPAPVVTEELAELHRLGIRLDVSIPALPVVNHACNSEGVVWPGEPASYSRRLRALGVDAYSFSLDRPLTSGAIDKAPNACHLTVEQAAESVARAVAAVHAVYPAAKIVDMEVPDGKYPAAWSATLQEWLTDYRLASGRNFDAFMMDAWWLFDWRTAASATVRVLANNHIPAGIFIDASGAKTVPATRWIALARQNACALRATGLPLDILDVANWQNLNVQGLPETDPSTLTGLVDWLAKGPVC